MLEEYYKEKEKRREQGLPALPLNAEQVQAIADLFESGEGSEELLLLLENEVPPGVDEAAYVKAAFLKDLALENISTDLISPQKAIAMLGTMLGGYSVEALVSVLKANKFGAEVASTLKHTILVYYSFNDIFDLNIDRSERPERPLPNGEISLKNAQIFGITLFILGILFSFLVQFQSGIIAFLTSLMALFYDRYTKDYLIVGSLNMGFCRGLNLMLGMSIIPVSYTHLTLPTKRIV